MVARTTLIRKNLLCKVQMQISDTWPGTVSGNNIFQKACFLWMVSWALYGASAWVDKNIDLSSSTLQGRSLAMTQQADGLNQYLDRRRSRIGLQRFTSYIAMNLNHTPLCHAYDCPEWVQQESPFHMNHQSMPHNWMEIEGKLKGTGHYKKIIFTFSSKSCFGSSPSGAMANGLPGSWSLFILQQWGMISLCIAEINFFQQNK